MLYCKFCNKVCKNNNSLRNHERLCKLNPERQYTVFSTPGFQQNCPNKCNQYEKARRNGLPDPIVSDETRNKISLHLKSRSAEWHKENGKTVSEGVKKRVLEGTWHTSLAKNMHYTYKGVDLHGKWELAFAKFLDKHGIIWERCKESFAYIFENVERRYTPDFYLPETEEYVEIKGYKIKKDEAKWSQFPDDKILTIYLGKDLKGLGLNIEL